MNAAQPQRLLVLDAFRALAISAVLAYHYLWAWGEPQHHIYGYTHLYPNGLRLGSEGVQFFFIISGFVIFMTLERCQTLAEFWFRRFARLYPVYFLVLLLSFVISNRFALPEFHSSSSDALFGLLLIPPTLTGGTFVDLAFWSLVVEAQFYACIGLLYMLARERFIAVWIVFVAVGIVCWLLGDVEPLRALRAVRSQLFLLPHFAQFTAGMAFYQFFGRRWARGSALMLTSLVAYLVVAHDVDTPRHVVNASMIVAFALFTLGALNWLAARPLVFLGSISYSLYLIHQNLGIVLIAPLTRLGAPDLVAASAAALACVGVAFALTRWVEIPAKRALLAWKLTGYPQSRARSRC